MKMVHPHGLIVFDQETTFCFVEKEALLVS